jgi:hypothetical protein
MNTFSLKATVCRVLALLYFVVALGVMFFVGWYNLQLGTKDDFLSVVFLLAGAACLWGTYVFSTLVDEHQLAANTEAQHAAATALAELSAQRDAAFLAFVELGMDDGLANMLANHDVLTLEAALDVEREYRLRGVSYHPWLAYRLVCAERFGLWCAILPEDVAMPMVVKQWRADRDEEPMQDDSHLFDEEEARMENMRGAAAAGDEWAQALLRQADPDVDLLDLVYSNGTLTAAEQARVAEYEQGDVHPWVAPRGCSHPALAENDDNDLPF